LGSGYIDHLHQDNICFSTDDSSPHVITALVRKQAESSCGGLCVRWQAIITCMGVIIIYINMTRKISQLCFSVELLLILLSMLIKRHRHFRA
jgi:hypothetical protein